MGALLDASSALHAVAVVDDSCRAHCLEIDFGGLVDSLGLGLSPTHRYEITGREDVETGTAEEDGGGVKGIQPRRSDWSVHRLKAPSSGKINGLTATHELRHIHHHGQGGSRSRDRWTGSKSRININLMGYI